MASEEVGKILEEIISIFPKHYAPETIETTLNVWSEALADIEYEFAHKALIAHLQKCEYPPTVAEIYKGARQIERDEYLAKGGIIYG